MSGEYDDENSPRPSRLLGDEEGTQGAIPELPPLAPYTIPPLVRAFLRQDYARVDPQLPKWLNVLSDVGAGECWHKKSSFKAHLFEVYKICKIWGQDEDVCRCALFHSAYSNSYVNLAVFQEGTERSKVAELVGPSAEQLIHTFCVVPRHNLVYDDLLGRCPPDVFNDLQLPTNTADSLTDKGPAELEGVPPALLRLVPPEGVTVRHIKTGEPLVVDRLTVARFLVMTMADFAEQLFSWQDAMFENSDGQLRYAGANHGSLWPGACKPGLWHSALSRMGLLLRTAVTGPDGRPLVPLPPVFGNCTQFLPEADQLTARDAYWRAVTTCTEPPQHDEALRLLRTATWHNPHVAEPHVLIAQVLMQRGQHAEAGRHAQRALQLMCEWGTAWDKRMPWEAWVAMSRVLLHGAARGVWPTSPFGMLNLGLVPGLGEGYSLPGEEREHE